MADEFERERWKKHVPPAMLYRLRMGRRRLRAWLERPIWLKRPHVRAGTEVCLLASFSADGSISAHTLHLSRAWAAQGFQVVLIIACDDLERVAPGSFDDTHLAGVVVRENLGYDFGSWSLAVRALPVLRDASLLVMANHSVYGPFDTFAAMVERARASQADLIGATDSYEVAHHMQSYLVFYRPKALRSAAFSQYWQRRHWGGRNETIFDSEIPLAGHFRDAGLTVDVLFPTLPDEPENSTLVGWRALVDRGFPFVKVQLLRENPFGVDLSGWADVLACHGYDPQRVVADLGERFATSPAAHALPASAVTSSTEAKAAGPA